MPDAYPTGSVMSITLGGGFSAKTVDCYAFDGSVFAKKNGGVVADLNGKVTIPLYDVRTVVIAIDSTAPVNHIVTVNCGANGTADPMNSQPVADGGSITVRIFPFDGYMVDSVTVDGVALTLDEKARLSGACELPLSNIRKDTAVEIKFTVMPVEENSGIGLVFVVVIISVALVGGGVLFFIQWKRTKYSYNKSEKGPRIFSRSLCRQSRVLKRKTETPVLPVFVSVCFRKITLSCVWDAYRRYTVIFRLTVSAERAGTVNRHPRRSFRADCQALRGGDIARAYI